jgi:hypothetical protein
MGALFRRGLKKGVFGGSRPWLVLWLVLAGLRVLRRITRDEPELVFSETLDPGQSLVISAQDRSSKVIDT